MKSQPASSQDLVSLAAMIHDTACAGIIHGLVPEAEIYSARVLGREARGRSIQFAADIAWAGKNNMHVINKC